MIVVSFDEYPVGELSSTAEVSNPFLDTELILNPSAVRSPEIKASPIGNCGAFYSNTHILKFDPEFTANSVLFQFAEYGGTSVFRVNGDELGGKYYLLDGSSGPNYTIAVSAEQDGNNWYGTVIVSGQIDSIEIEGQELLIDNVVFLANEEDIPNKVVIDYRDPNYSGSPPLAYNLLQESLEDQGYEVEWMTEATPDFPGDYDIYIGLLYNWNSEDEFFGYGPDDPVDLRDFVSNGGAALLVCEWGPAFSYPVYEFFLQEFDIQNGNNTVLDPVNGTFDGGKWVIYEQGRNFECHPAVNGIGKVELKAASTITGINGKPIINTSADATPPNTPVMYGQHFGEGRIAVVGDMGWLSSDISNWDNRSMALGLVQWISGRRQ